MTKNPAVKSSRGFTLVEVLVTLAIMGLVMLGLQVTLQSTVATHDELALEMAKVREGPRILDIIEADLRSQHCFNIKDKAVLKGSSQMHSGSRGDRLDLITATDSGRRFEDVHAPWDEPQTLSSDVTEVGYRLRLRDDGLMFSNTEPLLELYRREDLFVDDEPLEGGRYELLHDRVLFLEFRYITKLGDDGEKEDEWDVTKRQRLPAAVEVTVGLLPHSKTMIAGQTTERSVHRRIIDLNPTMNRSLALRSAPLVAIDENEVALTGGGGGGGGGGAKGPGDGMGGEGGPGGGGRGGAGGPGAGGSVMDGMGGRGGPGGGGRDGAPGGFLGGIRDGIFGIGGDIDLSDAEDALLDGWLDEADDRFGDG